MFEKIRLATKGMTVTKELIDRFGQEKAHEIIAIESDNIANLILEGKNPSDIVRKMIIKY